MALAAFQDALSQLVMSPAFLAQVRTDPEPALATLDLSPVERVRLAVIAQQPGVKVGTLIHRSFRLSVLAGVLPNTCTVIGHQGLKEVVHAYWSAQPPRGYYYEQEAARFGEYVLAQLAAGDLHNKYLEEVLRMELAVVSLARATYAEPPELTATALELRRPRLHPLSRIVLFRHEPATLLAALGQGHVPDTVPSGRYYLLFTRDAAGQVHIKPVDTPLNQVLEACDGHQTVAALCSELGVVSEDFAAWPRQVTWC